MVGTGNVVGLATTHVNFLITGDKEADKCLHSNQLSRSAANKLLSVFKQPDLDLRGQKQTSRKEGFSASGGTITTYGNYQVHTFLTSGTFLAVDIGSAEVLMDILVVGMVDAGGSGVHSVYETSEVVWRYYVFSPTIQSHQQDPTYSNRW